MEQVAGALKHILIISVLIFVVSRSVDKIGAAVTRFRFRTQIRRKGRKHAGKLENCRAVIRELEAGDDRAALALILENAAFEAVQLDADMVLSWLQEPSVKANLFVAELDNRIVGYAFCQFFSMGFSKSSANLTELYVQPEHRHGGLGSALVQKVTQHAGSFGFEAVNCAFAPQKDAASEFFVMIGALPSGMAHCLIPVLPEDIAKAEPEAPAGETISGDTAVASQTVH
ncbi:GNAT family N-acetyltransferase [Oricola sp.]|uniref:GNAT family N-acetyltransferase n=1 Tax=Oricola sp. TaxID=1979950 RepID=UPI003512E762